MRIRILSLLIVLSICSINGCGKSDLEIQKDQIRKQADELKAKIDSTRLRLDSAMVGYDSLKRKITKSGNEIDSLAKKINPLK